MRFYLARALVKSFPRAFSTFFFAFRLRESEQSGPWLWVQVDIDLEIRHRFSTIANKSFPSSPTSFSTTRRHQNGEYSVYVHFQNAAHDPLVRQAPKVRQPKENAVTNLGPQSEDGLVFGVAHIFASYVILLRSNGGRDVC
jgi:hypothetical protein